MTKEYTGEEFEIEFARAWYEYVKGGKIGIDPRRNWQVRGDVIDEWSILIQGVPQFCTGDTYRWKPLPKRMVHIGWLYVGEVEFNI